MSRPCRNKSCGDGPRGDEIFCPLADRVIIVAGPTASGKSELSLSLAQRIGGEIISLDALAVYREMDIGTAKPSRRDRDRIAHHLIDVVDPDQDFSVAMFLRLAHREVEQITARGRVPIFAGGTPMYLRAVLRGFDAGPPADHEFRASVEADVSRHGAGELHRRLRQVDPLSAHRIDPGDVRRMIRALEVSYLTGQPLSHRQIQHRHPTDLSRTVASNLAWDRSVLHDRINARTRSIFQAGLVDETRALIQKYRFSRTAAAAVGYREVIDMLQIDDDPDEKTLGQCEQAVAAHTRQLARRQETWFRSFAELTPIAGELSIDDQVEAISKRWFETRKNFASSIED